MRSCQRSKSWCQLRRRKRAEAPVVNSLRKLPYITKILPMYTEKLPRCYTDISDELHKNYGDITAELLLYYSTVSEPLHGN